MKIVLQLQFYKNIYMFDLSYMAVIIDYENDRRWTTIRSNDNHLSSKASPSEKWNMWYHTEICILLISVGRTMKANIPNFMVLKNKDILSKNILLVQSSSK